MLKHWSCLHVYDCGEQLTVLLARFHVKTNPKDLVWVQVGEYILVTVHHNSEKLCATCSLKPQSSGSVPKILYHMTNNTFFAPIQSWCHYSHCYKGHAFTLACLDLVGWCWIRTTWKYWIKLCWLAFDSDSFLHFVIYSYEELCL